MAADPSRSWLPTSGRRRYVVAAVLVVVAIAIATVVRVIRPEPVLAYALVSGRDDHGVTVADARDLRAGPDGEVVGTIPTGTLVAVHHEAPPWLYVTPVEGGMVSGWIDDFVLRGTVHVVLPDTPACPPTVADGVLEPSAQVRVVDHHRVANRAEVGIRLVTTGRDYHVPRAWLRDWHGPPRQPGTDCRDVGDLGEPVHDH